MGNGLFTIGHSNHSIARFLELLGLHRIALVCDVRSTPYSRFNPQFNREALAAALQRSGIGYLYLGDALGGKPKEPGYPADEQARYALIAASDRFRAGVERLLREAAVHRTAVLCAEQDPRRCHRGVLICPSIPVGVPIRHILADGSLLAHQDLPAGPHPDDPRQPSLL
jgi:uncharacterized protein (DUF488 family)